ncbi:polymorphic toxin-type HINT domain-containing protein [Streptomyces sp. 8L]|uniref:polymorphic toxin-type HINT domain-containing protein n=1 Tax=Streptomyces sp. 8L TaxID=2877242 RepID=UPI001CD4D64E|nr:polymorphic toxin-type HINT domain-containing protein [Streptomyces sp. 8L]MCA1217852.1 HINT domain-containing protein [Streptomyces sp. 8L]
MSVRQGDKVEATDPQTGVTATHTVQRVIKTTTDRDFTDLTVTATKAAGKGHAATKSSAVLTTTWHHPFWDAGTHQWVDASRLTPGTKLRESNGATALVAKVRNYHKKAVTYDLTIADLHTYYVLAGSTPVLVHNTACGITTRTEKAGDLGKYTEGEKTRDPASQWYHEELSNEELLDGINNPGEGGGLLVSHDGTILGGHHRWDELQTRVRDGRIDPDTPIRVDVYDPE